MKIFHPPLLEGWVIVDAKWVNIEEQRKKPDIGLVYGRIPIINSKVYSVLKDIGGVEFLPSRLDNQESYIMNVLNLEEGLLSLKLSKIHRFENRISYIDRYVFRKESSTDLFLLREYVNHIFCSEEFRDLIVNNGFSGLSFEKIKLKKWLL